jgi:hypothetical protein
MLKSLCLNCLPHLLLYVLFTRKRFLSHCLLTNMSLEIYDFLNSKKGFHIMERKGLKNWLIKVPEWNRKPGAFAFDKPYYYGGYGLCIPHRQPGSPVPGSICPKRPQFDKYPLGLKHRANPPWLQKGVLIFRPGLPANGLRTQGGKAARPLPAPQPEYQLPEINYQADHSPMIRTLTRKRAPRAVSCWPPVKPGTA